MARKVKRGGLLDYLYSLPELDWESKAVIAKAKKEYYKAYKKAWIQQHRKATKQFLISLSPAEVKEIADAARKHKLSRTRFIKQACISYLRKRYLPTDPLVLAVIRQLLGQNLIALQQLKNGNMVPADVGTHAMLLMSALERMVLDALYNPKEINV